MNYTELKNLIALTVEDQEQGFLDSIDGFIRAAEQRIYVEAEIPASRLFSPLNLVLGQREYTAPSGYLSSNEWYVDGVGAMIYKDRSFLKEAYPPNLSGAPRYYAQKDDNTLVVAPTPDDAYTGEIEYFGYPESIVTAGTSWLGDNYDQTLLYGALLEAGVFLKLGEARMVEYQERYRSAMAVLVKQVNGRGNRDDFRNGRVGA